MPAIFQSYNGPIGTNEVAIANAIKALLDQIPCLIFDEIHEEDNKAWVIYHFVGLPNARLKYEFTPGSGTAQRVTLKLYNGETVIRSLFADEYYPNTIFTVRIIASTQGLVIENFLFTSPAAFAASLNSEGVWIFYDIDDGLAWDENFQQYTLTNVYYSSIDTEGNYLLIPTRLVVGGSISTVLPGTVYSVYPFTGDRSFLNLSDGIHKAYYKDKRIFIV